MVFSGLPGTGKTTVAKALAATLGAVYLRIDTIEQAMKSAGAQDIGPAGYAVANAVAESNLLLGHSVVADCVNPVRESRLAWNSVAARAWAELVDVHLVCSDLAEHRRRVEERCVDVPGLIPLSWDDVIRQDFEPCDDDHLLLDTASLPAAEVVERIRSCIADRNRVARACLP